MSSTRHWQHPWLRISLLLRAVLTGHWSREAWQVIRKEIPVLLREKRRIQKSAWFN